jgi:hypothetical protein
MSHLAGFTVRVDLGPALAPDLVRLRPDWPRLLVGDAKATETPACTATRTRLLRYGAAARGWCVAGIGVTFVLCHDADPRRRWLACLETMATAAGLDTGSRDVSAVDSATWVTTLELTCQGVPLGEPDRPVGINRLGHRRAARRGGAGL